MLEEILLCVDLKGTFHRERVTNNPAAARPEVSDPTEDDEKTSLSHEKKSSSATQERTLAYRIEERKYAETVVRALN